MKKPIGITILLFALYRPAYAQFGGSVVFDPTVDSDLRLDTQVNSVTARSLITGGGAGTFQSNASYLNSLGQNLTHGISDSQTFAANFPGWLALGPDAAQTAKQVSSAAMNTYVGAFSVAQQQANGFSSEDGHLASIEGRNQAAQGALQAIQVNTEAQLAVAQQIQLMRQLLVTQITMDAVAHGEQLNERARAEATSAKSLNLGVAP
jgi:P-type conjugative transfer protein TrbJ